MKPKRIMIAGAAGLTACGVLGMAPGAALAGAASVHTWTKQHPATSPPARQVPAMAYDAATRTVVLFGGATDTLRVFEFRGTWVWA